MATRGQYLPVAALLLLLPSASYLSGPTVSFLLLLLRKRERVSDVGPSNPTDEISLDKHRLSILNIRRINYFPLSTAHSLSLLKLLDLKSKTEGILTDLIL